MVIFSSCTYLSSVIDMWPDLGMDGLQSRKDTWKARRTGEWWALPHVWCPKIQNSVLAGLCNLCCILLGYFPLYSIRKVSEKTIIFIYGLRLCAIFPLPFVSGSSLSVSSTMPRKKPTTSTQWFIYYQQL